VKPYSLLEWTGALDDAWSSTHLTASVRRLMERRIDRKLDDLYRLSDTAGSWWINRNSEKEHSFVDISRFLALEYISFAQGIAKYIRWYNISRKRHKISQAEYVYEMLENSKLGICLHGPNMNPSKTYVECHRKIFEDRESEVSEQRGGRSVKESEFQFNIEHADLISQWLSDNVNLKNVELLWNDLVMARTANVITDGKVGWLDNVAGAAAWFSAGEDEDVDEFGEDRSEFHMGCGSDCSRDYSDERRGHGSGLSGSESLDDELDFNPVIVEPTQFAVELCYPDDDSE
jgi:hypothetical protein